MSDKRGLFNCFGSIGECCCAVGSCACPCTGYAYNYHLATQSTSLFSDLVPYHLHSILSGIKIALCYSASFPLPFLDDPLRTTHRAALFPHEGLGVGCLKEVFCWGCSIAEVNRELTERVRSKAEPLQGNSLLGVLYPPEPNHM